MGPLHDDRTTGQPDGDRNRHSLVRLGFMVVVTLMVAMMAPPQLMLAMFSSMAFVAAMVIAGFALLFGEQPDARHFTRWDEAMAMLGLSMLTGFLVDPDVVQATIEGAQGMGPEPSAGVIVR